MVRYLLDTNVISEATKTHAQPTVYRWLSGVPATDAYISVITVAELRTGAELMPMGARRRHLEQWLERAVLMRIGGNIVEVDLEVAAMLGT